LPWHLLTSALRYDNGDKAITRIWVLVLLKTARTKNNVYMTVYSHMLKKY